MIYRVVWDRFLSLSFFTHPFLKKNEPPPPSCFAIAWPLSRRPRGTSTRRSCNICCVSLLVFPCLSLSSHPLSISTHLPHFAPHFLGVTISLVLGVPVLGGRGRNVERQHLQGGRGGKAHVRASTPTRRQNRFSPKKTSRCLLLASRRVVCSSFIVFPRLP